jgi:hypothetical protein
MKPHIPTPIRAILATIIATGLIAAAGLARGQSINVTNLAQDLSPLLTATNYSFELYGTYAPTLPKHVGAGLLAVYNVNQYVGVGVGGDELGRFNMISADATLQLPIYPLTFLGNDFGSNFAIVPVQLFGAAVPLSGTSGNGLPGSTGGIVISDTGGYFKFGHVYGGQLDAGAAWGQWNNAGSYSGWRYHFFAGWVKNF